jgi:streptogrisin C
MLRLPFFLLASLLAAASAQAQPAAVQSSSEALAQDAAEYARLRSLSVEEGLRRLRAQAESAAITAEIRREFGARLAGIAVIHAPEFHIRVLLTGDAPVPDRIVAAGGSDLPIRFRTGARATAEQLVAAIGRHRTAIDALIDHSGIGVDQRTGEMVVVADTSDFRDRAVEAVTAELAALTGVPVRVNILGQRNADLGITGGRRLEGREPADGRNYFCTTGYVVTNGARTGIVTAAHCPDSVSYTDAAGNRVPLEFAGGWGAQFQDVQVHVGAGEQQPVFRASTADRPQLARRLRAHTRAGETVCHRGEASGYSCSEVELTDFAPPGTLCGGRCHPTWMTVSGPGCRGGDSGGPVFAGTTAFGIVKGGNYASDGSCNFYFYMSTDYLPPGWSLLLAPPEPAATPPPPPAEPVEAE